MWRNTEQVSQNGDGCLITRNIQDQIEQGSKQLDLAEDALLVAGELG